MTSEYFVTIIVTFVGFTALAAALLVPVYRFLKKEEEVSRSWTPEALQERADAEDAAKDAAKPDHGA